MTERANRLEIFGRRDHWYVRLTFSNGEKAMVSESYTRKADAFRAAFAIEGALAVGRPVVKGGERVAKKTTKKSGTKKGC